jgi:transcriptional regulator with XRE-family HTH domain
MSTQHLSPETRHTLKCIGVEIHARREKLGLDIMTLAARAGIDADLWAGIEAGEINATMDDLFAIAEVLGAPLHEIVKAAI